MGDETVTREIYEEVHGFDLDEEVGEVCTLCGGELRGRYFEVNDASGHDRICEKCLKKMSITDLAELFGVELKYGRE